MESDEIWQGESILEKFVNVIKRTPDSITSEKESGEEFESAEHENIGDKVKLRYPVFGSGGELLENEVPSTERLLMLPNKLKLSFGQIIALAGDFYGVPEYPIVDPNEPPHKQSSGRRQRFIAAYNTLANAEYAQIKNELDEILKIMTTERNEIEAVLEAKEGKVVMFDGKDHIRMVPKDVYKNLGNSLAEKYDEKIGGKWMFGVPVIFGRMMKLADNNTDHFLPFAKDAYLAGHELALEKAREASQESEREKKMRLLEEAYSIDAFACHFLTDSFSSGHLKTPRLELSKKVTPSKIGSFLSKCMHDEDNKYGIHVTNKKGDKWIAYGDGMLLNDESRDNYKISINAVQESVNQVFRAFLSPDERTSSSLVSDYIPYVDTSQKNNYPMFQMKDGKLVRRANLNKLNDSATTSRWIGVTTAFELHQSYSPDTSAIEEYVDDDIDCRSCGQSLHPKLLSDVQ